jgi:hypothetical protein
VIVLRHSSANRFIDGSLPKGVPARRALDGADRFAFEEFGVGSKAEPF